MPSEKALMQGDTDDASCDNINMPTSGRLSKGCCPRAFNGHAAAAPSPAMSLRRLIAILPSSAVA
jgi:hypothetical protein